MKKYKFSKPLSLAVISLVALSSLPTSTLASSHREAPFISQDTVADGTDVYAFVSPDKQDTVTLIANYIPFQEPAGGPNFYRFGDDVLYEIKIDNTADGREDISYQFRFQTHINNKETFLYNTGPVNSITDPNLNVYQTYTVTKVRNGKAEVLGQNLRVPPSYVGNKSTPNYANLSSQGVYNIADNSKVFAGQKDDPFFVDLGLFDLLSIRKLPGNAGGGVDQLKGYNVSSIAIQVPILELGKIDSINPRIPNKTTDIIGVWSTSSRQSNKVLSNTDFSTNRADKGFGQWIQISRLGSPLVNEVIIPLGDKDAWNNAKPFEESRFVKYFENPELGGLLKALYGIKTPTATRDDLNAVFLTGVPGLTKSNVRANVPSEMLRLNMSIKPTANPNRFGVLGGDNQGFPNGRRLIDDVTDIEIRAVAGVTYKLFHPEFALDPLANQLGDGVDTNDKPFENTFPYLATAHNGFTSVPHSTTSGPSAMEKTNSTSFMSMIKNFLNNLF
jgi:hypothetical protein